MYAQITLFTASEYSDIRK